MRHGLPVGIRRGGPVASEIRKVLFPRVWIGVSGHIRSGRRSCVRQGCLFRMRDTILRVHSRIECRNPGRPGSQRRIGCTSWQEAFGLKRYFLRCSKKLVDDFYRVFRAVCTHGRIVDLSFNVGHNHFSQSLRCCLGILHLDAGLVSL